MNTTEDIDMTTTDRPTDRTTDDAVSDALVAGDDPRTGDRGRTGGRGRGCRERRTGAVAPRVGRRHRPEAW